MIEGQFVRLRPLDRRHIETTRAWTNQSTTARPLAQAWPVFDNDDESWYVDRSERRDRAYFAIETVSIGCHVGNVWLRDIDWRHRKAEIRMLIDEGAGLAQECYTESLSLASRYAFERLNLHRVSAYVLSLNPRALSAFEKAGFVLEGTLRQDRWMGNQPFDVHLLGLLA